MVNASQKSQMLPLHALSALLWNFFVVADVSTLTEDNGLNLKNIICLPLYIADNPDSSQGVRLK